MYSSGLCLIQVGTKIFFFIFTDQIFQSIYESLVKRQVEIIQIKLSKLIEY